ncbi:MAG TPA: hypothetical protein VGK73_32280 [Polyangiaceae bacterium]
MNRARIWFEWHTDGSARQRREARAAWYDAAQAARVLAEVRASLVVMAAQGRGLRTSAGAPPWTVEALHMGRHRATVKARDLLWMMRQARAAGVLRCRVPS